MEKSQNSHIRFDVEQKKLTPVLTEDRRREIKDVDREVRGLGLDFGNRIRACLDNKQQYDYLPIAGKDHFQWKILDAAIKIEQVGGKGGIDNEVIAELERLKKFIGRDDLRKKHRPTKEELISTIARRVQSGQGGFRGSLDIDLENDEFEALTAELDGDVTNRRLVEEMSAKLVAIREALDKTETDLEMAREELDTDPKFPMIMSNNRFTKEVEDCVEPGNFVIFDLVKFKELNNALGYIFVDSVLLQRVSDALADHSGTNAIARFGGDEFVLFYAGQDDRRLWPTICHIAEVMNSVINSISVEDVRSHWMSLHEGFRERFEPNDREEGCRQALLLLQDCHAKIGAIQKLSGSVQCKQLIADSQNLVEQAATEKENMRYPARIEGQTVQSALEG